MVSGNNFHIMSETGVVLKNPFSSAMSLTIKSRQMGYNGLYSQMVEGILKSPQPGYGKKRFIDSEEWDKRMEEFRESLKEKPIPGSELDNWYKEIADLMER
jgi:hypothetical protein